MTVPSQQPSGNREPSHQDAASGHGTPVIVLAYPHVGMERLWSLLAANPALACTSGTGILPLCEQAAATWRGADSRTGAQLSPLAVTSTRALTTGVITAILARLGRRRWCEFATALPSSAETFLRLYPQTRVLCLHRACADVIYATLHASPWGLAGPEFAPFIVAYPGSIAAALTAYWTARTRSLIEFEEAHPEVCRRIRYEDLTEEAHADALLAFLGLQAPDPDILIPAHVDVAAQAYESENGPPPGDADDRVPFPADQIPPPLLAQAHSLLTKLGYPLP
jgi:hypothetical protein